MSNFEEFLTSNSGLPRDIKQSAILIKVLDKKKEGKGGYSVDFYV
jgi:hypothetical protein